MSKTASGNLNIRRHTNRHSHRRHNRRSHNHHHRTLIVPTTLGRVGQKMGHVDVKVAQRINLKKKTKKKNGDTLIAIVISSSSGSGIMRIIRTIIIIIIIIIIITGSRFILITSGQDVCDHAAHICSISRHRFHPRNYNATPETQNRSDLKQVTTLTSNKRKK